MKHVNRTLLERFATAVTLATLTSLLPDSPSDFFNRGMAKIRHVEHALAEVCDLGKVQKVIRHAARDLTGADGAVFVLRDCGFCYYADEDAIEPLWKGRRFPMALCISGWVMLYCQPACIEDIYADPRIPVEAYRPTFVKSLAMVPIRAESPIGAIGNFWAQRHAPTTEEVDLLQNLAATTARVMERVPGYDIVERRLQS